MLVWLLPPVCIHCEKAGIHANMPRIGARMLYGAGRHSHRSDLPRREALGKASQATPALRSIGTRMHQSLWEFGIGAILQVHVFVAHLIGAFCSHVAWRMSHVACRMSHVACLHVGLPGAPLLLH